MLFTRSNLNKQHNSNIHVHLERVDQTKLLCIIIDNNSSSICHVDTLSEKLASARGAIKKVKFFIPESVVKILYFFSSLSTFTLGDLCLGSSGT